MFTENTDKSQRKLPDPHYSGFRASKLDDLCVQLTNSGLECSKLKALEVASKVMLP